MHVSGNAGSGKGVVDNKKQTRIMDMGKAFSSRLPGFKCSVYEGEILS